MIHYHFTEDPPLPICLTLHFCTICARQPKYFCLPQMSMAYGTVDETKLDIFSLSTISHFKSQKQTEDFLVDHDVIKDDKSTETEIFLSVESCSLA